ncbi:MAG TPA: hypothetical protein VFJ19_05885 [Nocardioidaceae bacterium]|nr:hypothetical protein [Nocardioidaceae bacterium]
MLTFTLVGSAFSAINAVWTKVRQNLRRLFRFEAAYVVECNRGGAPGHDHHLHALAHGTVPHPELLSEKAQAAGWGMGVDVTPVRDVDGFARYLLKQVREETLEHHLEMNGRQLIHTTRGFWRLGGRRVSGGMDALLRTAR